MGVLVALVNDLHWEIDRRRGTTLILLDILVTLNMTNCGSILDCLSRLGLKALFCSGTSPTWKIDLEGGARGLLLITFAFGLCSPVRF